MTARPPLTPTSLSFSQLEHLLYFLPPGSAGSLPVAAMDRSKVISLFLLFPDGLLPWKDPKRST